MEIIMTARILNMGEDSLKIYSMLLQDNTYQSKERLQTKDPMKVKK
jgi:hypothetical protein